MASLSRSMPFSGAASIASSVAAVAVLMTLLASPALAQYTKLNVKGRVELEVPDSWSISDAEQRKRVSELSAELTGRPSTYIASLSVQSFPAPSKVFVRVSFLELDPPITQAQVRQEVRADAKQVVADLAEMWATEAPQMWAALGKKGIKEVGRASFAVEPLGGQMALVIRYGRTSVGNQADTMRVVQYHIPLGAEKVMITLSHIESSPEAVAAQERVRKSFVIR